MSDLEGIKRTPWWRGLCRAPVILALVVGLLAVGVPFLANQLDTNRKAVVTHVKALQRGDAKAALSVCDDPPSPLMTDEALRAQRAAGLEIRSYSVSTHGRYGSRSLVEVKWTSGGRDHEETFVVDNGRIHECAQEFTTLLNDGVATISGVPVPRDERVFIGSYELKPAHELLFMEGSTPSPSTVKHSDKWPASGVEIRPDRLDEVNAAITGAARRCLAAAPCPRFPYAKEIIGVNTEHKWRFTIHTTDGPRLWITVPVDYRDTDGGMGSPNQVDAWVRVDNGTVVAELF